MNREASLDYIRIILISMIVTFHFCEANVLYESVFFTMANGTWGWVATTAFLILSGFLLRKKYNKLEKISLFYKKRFLSIFPAFYLAFAICFIIHSISLKSPFYGGHPVKIIFSILGIDSYLGLYGISTYAVVGEWFTGLILIMYILYPLLNKLMNKSRIAGTAILFVLYFVNIIWGIDPTTSDASVITGIFIFWCGMLISEYENQIKKHWWISFILTAVFILLSIIPIPIPGIFTTNLMGILLFIILLAFLQKTGRNKKINEIAGFLSRISYEVYLIHHFVLYKCVNVFKNFFSSGIKIAVYYILIVGLIIAFAAAIHYLTKLFTDKIIIKKIIAN